MSDEIQHILESNRIPMHIHGVKGSGDGSMDEHKGNTACTVTALERTLTLQDGEVVVTVVQGYQRKQISIDPSFLIPWNTVVGSMVVATNGPFLGLTGVVVGSKGEGTFSTVNVPFPFFNFPAFEI